MHGFPAMHGGSPPPMRGKAAEKNAKRRRSRITPAYAGKSLGSVSIRSHIQDHPRLCGEKEANVQFFFHSLGSPPPMRGKALKMNFSRGTNRITPAYAGKSYILFVAAVNMRDHPRLCGEKAAVNFFFRSLPGSPPPMRGKAVPKIG